MVVCLSGEEFMATETIIQQNKATVERLYEEVLLGKNNEVLNEIIANDVVIHVPPEAGGDTVGRDAYVATVKNVQKAFPDLDVEHLDVYAGEDHVVMRNRYTGTHEGEYMGIEPTGAEVTYDGMVLFRLEDGKVAEAWGQIDTLGLLTQFGVVEPPQQ